MNYSEIKKFESVLKKQKINCFVDPNSWETKDGYNLYFHKITYAKKTIDYFSKEGIETYDILPNTLNAYFKYILEVKPSEKLEKLIAEEKIWRNNNPCSSLSVISCLQNNCNTISLMMFKWLLLPSWIADKQNP